MTRSLSATSAASSSARPSRLLHLHGQGRAWIISLLLYAFFLIVLIWPIWRVLETALFDKKGAFTFAYLRLIFHDPMLVRGLLNATIIAVAVTGLSLLMSLPLAILGVRYDFPGRNLLSGLLLAPLVLPPFVGAIGVRLILSRFGPLSMLLGYGHGVGFDWLGRYRIIGILLVETLHLYPVLLLNLQASLANIDPAMEQAAANLGANRWTIFRKITLPLARPGLFAGCTLTLIWSFTELGTPLMFDFSTITPVQIYRQVTDVAANPLPYALVIVTLVASVLLYLIGKVTLGRGYESATTKAATGWSPRRLRGWRAALAGAPFVIVLALALLPHLSVVLTSLTSTGQWYRSILPQSFTLSHYGSALLDDLAIPSVLNSVTYATLATVIAVVIGLAAAIVIVRSDIPGRQIIDALAMLPLAVPGLVLAFGYLAISTAWKQKYGARLPVWLDVPENPVCFLVIAYAARRMPYVVRSAVAGLQQTPRDLELAAQNLGASRAVVLRRITIPLIMANLLAGALLAFAFALLEVSDSLILAQKAAYFPITRAILELSRRLGDGLYVASALGVWAMLLLTLTLLAANSLIGRRMGAIFRT
jgi:iron(III) transport system permease protein